MGDPGCFPRCGVSARPTRRRVEVHHVGTGGGDPSKLSTQSARRNGRDYRHRRFPPFAPAGHRLLWVKVQNHDVSSVLGCSNGKVQGKR
ncbi:MAG: hypothetical protein OXJ56_18600 [Rhodospirillaceae bacterium]|nr:hypothetical protein [Rhodospirillaceae bacterium]